MVSNSSVRQVTATADEIKTPLSGIDENEPDGSVISLDTSHTLNENDSYEAAQPPGVNQPQETLQSLKSLPPLNSNSIHSDNSRLNQRPPLNNQSVSNSTSLNNDRPPAPTPLFDLIRSTTQTQRDSCTNTNRERKEGKKHIKDYDQYQLQRWVYENSDKAQTVAEILEKRRWEQ